MTRLLILVHADPSVVPLYRAALPADVDVVAFVAPPLAGVAGGGMSSRYAALGQQLRAQHGSILAGLGKRYPPPRPMASYDAVYMATWSAGYALPRLFSVHDRDALAGLVLLDSGHAARQTLMQQAQWAAEWAMLARDSRKLFAIGHSDVRTYGDVVSTTDFAREVVRQAGEPGGMFVVRAFDVAREDNPEHVAALRGWGPAFVAEALALVEPQPPTDPSSPPAWGDAVLDAAKVWLDRAPREDRGRNRGDAIDSWLRAVGVALGNPYCAAFVSQCIRDAAVRVGRTALVAGSAGAKALGYQFPPALRTPRGPALAASLRPGDLLVSDRSKPGPGEDGPAGHIRIVIERVGDHSAGVIEGNADRLVEPTTGQIYAVVQSEVRLDDPDILFACHWPEMS